MLREEKDYKRWIQQKEQDQKRINGLQEEIERNKQQKTLLVKKMKDHEDRYREWRERHHKEVQQLKRTAIKAEYSIRKLERENAKYKAVLRRREEEKAAMQRNTREIALANARTAKTSVTAAPVVSSSISSGQGSEGARPVSQVSRRPPRPAPLRGACACPAPLTPPRRPRDPGSTSCARRRSRRRSTTSR